MFINGSMWGNTSVLGRPLGGISPRRTTTSDFHRQGITAAGKLDVIVIERGQGSGSGDLSSHDIACSERASIEALAEILYGRSDGCMSSALISALCRNDTVPVGDTRTLGDAESEA